MSSDRPDLKSLWTAQETEGFSMSLEDIRARSAKMQRIVRRRNLHEYIAAGVVVLWFGLYVVLLPGLLVKLGSVMVILGTFFMVWQLHKRGSVRAQPLEGSALDYIAFHRRELVRQRDALRSVLRWYIGPFVPGVVVMLTGISLLAPHGRSLFLPVAGTAALCAAVFAGVWLLNRWGAARLQKQIDALDRMSSE